MTSAERVERLLRSAAPALVGYRNWDVEDWICEDLEVNPRKHLAVENRACGCRRSRGRGTLGLRLCEAYAIPQVNVPCDWYGGFARPDRRRLERWATEVGLR